ncbi:hypothetical protein X975_17889, partial [Stegodyphus mimosarum]
MKLQKRRSGDQYNEHLQNKVILGAEFLRAANATINFGEISIVLDMVPKVVEEEDVPEINLQHLKQGERAKLEELVTQDVQKPVEPTAVNQAIETLKLVNHEAKKKRTA